MLSAIALSIALLMADTIAGLPVPSSVSSGLTFPIVSDTGYGMIRPWKTVVHRFGDLATTAEQRFLVGIGPRKFAFRRESLTYPEARYSLPGKPSLWDFYEAVQGSFQSFTYPVPQPDRQTFVPYQVIFEQKPLTIEDLVNRCRTGFNFVEVPDPNSAPSYPVNATCLRFPSDVLATALLSQEQQIIPLVHILVRNPTIAGLDDMYFSDRRVTIGGRLYLPRLLGIGEQGSDVIMTQSLSGGPGTGGGADTVRFTLGNSDRMMTQVSNTTDLKYASIELCLYHVQTGIFLQLWKGFIQSYQSDGTSQFQVQASDGLYPIALQYPLKTISHTCGKPFDDGTTCPYSQQGSGGDPKKCDRTFGLDANGNLIPFGVDGNGNPLPGSANGCAQHGMTPFFGGHPINPQGVRIKDNSSGSIFGIGRNTITATSIVSDTAWGQALPEIWCNDDGDPLNAYIASAVVVDYRDESDFADALGIIGAGPIGKFTVDDPRPLPQGQGGILVTNADGYTYVLAPMVDGYAPQGFKVDITKPGQQSDPKKDNDLGLRQIPGFDPVPANDPWFGQPGVTNSAGSITLGQGTPQQWGIPAGSNAQKAAGTAFAELRIVKSSQLQPSTPDQHQMTVPISQGLTGVVFDSAGTPTQVPGLTNPFWVAINSWLRALGIDRADAATQLASFVLSALVVGDGESGAAEIADLPPAVPLLETDTGPQFRFQGTLGQQKPFRDWLGEILSTALGYYTFEFGKLKLGIRENAGGVSGFGLGNMLYQSLVLTPIEASFEHLVIDFADKAYQYKANTAEYQDFDHAAYYGRAGAPLTKRQHSVGCSSLAQALRLATVRTREEIGGIEAREWAAARNATWKTTILALETEVGQVVDILHPDLPGGYDPGTWTPGGPGNWLPNTNSFRITKWTLHKDWSITIEGRTVTPSMYDIEAGPKPADVLPAPLPVLLYPVPLQEWMPYQVQADPNDALFPSEYNFDVSQAYNLAADGSAIATVTAAGKQPVDSFIPNCGAPVIHAGELSVDKTTGQIPGGLTLRVSVTACNAAGGQSPPSATILVVIPPDTDTNAFMLDGIIWPPGANLNLTGYNLFASTKDDLICFQQSGIGLPSSIIVTGPLSLPDNPVVGVPRSTWALPDPDENRLRIKVKRGIHFGIVGFLADSVNGNQIVSQDSIANVLEAFNGPPLLNPVSGDVQSGDVDIFEVSIPSGVPPVPGTILQYGGELMQVVYLNGLPYQTGFLGGNGFYYSLIAPGIYQLVVLRGYNSTPVSAHPAAGVTLSPIGRKLICIGRASGSTPFAAFNITDFDSGTGTYTLDRDAAAAGILPGDCFAVSFLGYDNSANPYNIQDAGLANSVNLNEFGVTGETPNDPNRIGNIVRVIDGYSRGSWAKIVANGQTDYTLDRPLQIDATSTWIVESGTWQYQAESTIQNASATTTGRLPVAVQNFSGLPVVVMGITLDDAGGESAEEDAPLRLLFIYGQPNFLSEADEVTFGLPTDSTTQGPNGNGTNAPNGYKNILVPGQPFTGWISCVQAPTSADTIIDLLLSEDGGATWDSIFGSGPKIVFKTTDVGQALVSQFKATLTGVVSVSRNVITWISGDQFTPSMTDQTITIDGVQVQVDAVVSPTQLVTSVAPGDGANLLYQFGVIQLGVPGLLRVDVIQGGGATGINGTIKWGAPLQTGLANPNAAGGKAFSFYPGGVPSSSR